jgi:uroporphyrinogen decarboxylase
MNSLLLNALRCNNTTSRPPVWLMRQAGRYMPEFRKIRKQYSFLDVCHDPELAAEVTMLPVHAFNMDAAILFSDILILPEAFDIGLRFEDKVGPVIDRPIQSMADIAALPCIDVKERLSFVSKAIERLIPKLQVPLIGFCGGPFTVASYMIEGGSSRDLKKTKQWLFKDPESFHCLLNLITEHTLQYMHLQAEAGVHAFQIFDSWANFLADAQFREFSLHYLRRLVQGFKFDQIPVILFCKGASVFAQQLAETGAAAISVDWNGNLAQIRALVSPRVAIQGNLDPDALYAPQKLLKKEVRQMLKSMEGDPGYIFNLGHGIHPDISVDAVKTLVDTVHSFSPAS